jgi:hypothetical protein
VSFRRPEAKQPDCANVSLALNPTSPKSVIPSTITAKLACNSSAALGIAILVALETAAAILDLDFGLVEEVDDGADARACATAVGAALSDARSVK